MAFGYENREVTSEQSGSANATPAATQSMLGIPNSSMQAMVYEDPATEDEAVKLSAGVTATNPDDVKSEMGKRLGADFSKVRVHTGANSMGAGAMAQGSDIYLGRGGFNPTVMAHELVHTVQQGAVKGAVSESAPAGSIQFFGNKKDKNVDTIFRLAAGSLAEMIEGQLLYNVTYDREYDQRKADYMNSDGGMRKHSEKDASKLADNEADEIAYGAQKTARKRLKKADEDRLNRKIKDMDEAEIREVISRRMREGEKLYRLREEMGKENIFDDKFNRDRLDYLASQSSFALNFMVYDYILQHLQDRRDVITRVKNEFLKNRSAADKKKDDRILEIANAGNDSRNTYRTQVRDKNTRLFRELRDNKDESEVNYFDKIFKEKIDQPVASSKKDKSGSIAGINRMARQILSNNAQYDIREQVEDDKESVSDEKEDGKLNESLKKNVSGDADAEVDFFGDELNKSIYIDRDSAVVDGLFKTIEENGGRIEDNILPVVNEEDKAKGNASGAGNAVAPAAPAEKSKVDPNVVAKESRQWINYTKSANKGLTSSTEVYGLNRNSEFTKDSNFYTDYIKDPSGFVGDTLGVGAGLIGSILMYKGFKKDIANLGAGASMADMGTSGLDTLGAVGGTANSVMSGINRAKKVLTGGAVKNVGPSKLVPGLSIATGAISALTGGVKAARGFSASHTISKQIDELKKSKALTSKSTKDKAQLTSIFKHAKKISNINGTSGLLKMGSGAISGALGIITLSGPAAPMTAAAMGIAGAVVGVGRSVYDQIRKKSAHRDIVLEYLGKNSWDEIENLVRSKATYKKTGKNVGKIKGKQARAVYLHSMGLGYTREEAFKIITEKRAKFLLNAAKGGSVYSDLARKVVSTLGVHRKNEEYTEGALKLLVSKLS